MLRAAPPDDEGSRAPRRLRPRCGVAPAVHQLAACRPAFVAEQDRLLLSPAMGSPHSAHRRPLLPRGLHGGLRLLRRLAHRRAVRADHSDLGGPVRDVVGPQRWAWPYGSAPSDVLAAQHHGLTGVLVKTGKYRRETHEAAPGTPDHVVNSFADVRACWRSRGRHAFEVSIESLPSALGAVNVAERRRCRRPRSAPSPHQRGDAAASVCQVPQRPSGRGIGTSRSCSASTGNAARTPDRGQEDDSRGRISSTRA
jgi:hypothetical protein